MDRAFEDLAGYTCTFEVREFHLYEHGTDRVWRAVHAFAFEAGPDHEDAVLPMSLLDSGKGLLAAPAAHPAVARLDAVRRRRAATSSPAASATSRSSPSSRRSRWPSPSSASSCRTAPTCCRRSPTPSQQYLPGFVKDAQPPERHHPGGGAGHRRPHRHRPGLPRRPGAGRAGLDRGHARRHPRGLRRGGRPRQHRHHQAARPRRAGDHRARGRRLGHPHQHRSAAPPAGWPDHVGLGDNGWVVTLAGRARRRRGRHRPDDPAAAVPVRGAAAGARPGAGRAARRGGLHRPEAARRPTGQRHDVQPAVRLDRPRRRAAGLAQPHRPAHAAVGGLGGQRRRARPATPPGVPVGPSTPPIPVGAAGVAPDVRAPGPRTAPRWPPVRCWGPPARWRSARWCVAWRGSSGATADDARDATDADTRRSAQGDGPESRGSDRAATVSGPGSSPGVPSTCLRDRDPVGRARTGRVCRSGGGRRGARVGGRCVRRVCWLGQGADQAKGRDLRRRACCRRRTTGRLLASSSAQQRSGGEPGAADPRPARRGVGRHRALRRAGRRSPGAAGVATRGRVGRPRRLRAGDRRGRLRRRCRPAWTAAETLPGCTSRPTGATRAPWAKAQSSRAAVGRQLPLVPAISVNEVGVAAAGGGADEGLLRREGVAVLDRRSCRGSCRAAGCGC